MNSPCFKLRRFYSISVNLSNIGDIISGVESERTGSKFTKRKRKFLCCVHSCSITWAGEIRKFHVAVGRDRSMVITDEKGRSNYHLKTVRVENMFSTKKVFLKPSNVEGVDKYHDLF